MLKLNQFPETGWCKSLDERLIKFIKNKYQSSKDTLEKKDTGIAWGLKDFWFVQTYSTQDLYEFEQLEPFLEQKKYEYEVVHCTTQEEWDFVCDKLKTEWAKPDFVKQNYTCMAISYKGWHTLEHFQNIHCKILSFEEFCNKFNHQFLNPEYLYTETPDKYIVKTYNGKIGYTNYICGKDFYDKRFNNNFKWENYRTATQEEIDWLENCIKENKFVPKPDKKVFELVYLIML